MNTSNRKIEHLKLCASREVEAHKDEHGLSRSGFDDIMILHNALPEVNKTQIDAKTRFLGHNFTVPLMIASMTGGHPDTTEVNRALAIAAQQMGIGIGVGSQRAALEDPALEDSFRVVRENAPDAFVYGNIGVAQLREYGIEGVQRAAEMIDADAMAIHLNFLQEAVQPEGDTDATGGLELIRQICHKLKIPVIVKETGAGINHKVAEKLHSAGVSAIDVGGLGGTSWAGVEVYRARGDSRSEALGQRFWDWGIPTAASIIECSDMVPLIATGGIRTGIDVAKSIALGADVCGIALPLLGPALKGPAEVRLKLESIVDELITAMFLTGCSTTSDLKQVPAVIGGKTRQYLNERGFDISKYARRG